MQYFSTKIIPLGSCAFRQWRSHENTPDSRCYLMHGYRLTSKITFSCKELDENNWVVNFGGLKEVKKMLEEQFDHTTCISKDDPYLDTFKDLHQKGVIDLRVMDGVGIEKFAEFIFNKVNEYIKERTNNRCWVQQVEVWEHEQNSAGCVNITQNDIEHALNALEREKINRRFSEKQKTTVTGENSEGTIPENIKTQKAPKPMTESAGGTMPSPTQVQPPAPPSSVANPLYAKTSTGWSDPFKGTSWGNK